MRNEVLRQAKATALRVAHTPSHVAARLRRVFKRLTIDRPDPHTGDMLRFTEQVSWRMQRLIRTWPFILGITLGSLAWWAAGSIWHEDTLFVWNAIASLVAIIIESLVGLGMYTQTRRDAVILRKVLRLLDKVLEEVENDDTT